MHSLGTTKERLCTHRLSSGSSRDEKSLIRQHCAAASALCCCWLARRMSIDDYGRSKRQSDSGLSHRCRHRPLRLLLGSPALLLPPHREIITISPGFRPSLTFHQQTELASFQRHFNLIFFSCFFSLVGAGAAKSSSGSSSHGRSLIH